MSVSRNRLHSFFLIIGTIGLGLASRSGSVPALIYPYLGDVLYALMIYFMIGFVWPKAPSLQAAALCVLVCYGIELSQLYQADWINALRRTRLGGLVLGFGFLWSDLVCYLVGAFVGVGLEYWFLRK
jgi:hypothetical protein